MKLLLPFLLKFSLIFTLMMEVSTAEKTMAEKPVVMDEAKLKKQFDEIVADIQLWIINGGSDSLNFPEGVTPESYRTAMLKAISDYTISFTHKTLRINGAIKPCINNPDEKSVLCNFNFASYPKSQQYEIGHHEMAGVAKLEVNDGKQRSNYDFTSQLAGFMELQLEWKLALRPIEVASLPDGTGCSELYLRKSPKLYKNVFAVAMGSATALLIFSARRPDLAVPFGMAGLLAWVIPSKAEQYEKNYYLMAEAKEYVLKKRWPGKKLSAFVKKVNKTVPIDFSAAQIAQSLVNANYLRTICSQKIILNKDLATYLVKNDLIH